MPISLALMLYLSSFCILGKLLSQFISRFVDTHLDFDRIDNRNEARYLQYHYPDEPKTR